MLLKGGNNDTSIQCIYVCCAVPVRWRFILRAAEDSVRRDEENDEDVLLDRSCSAVLPAVACPVITVTNWWRCWVPSYALI